MPEYLTEIAKECDSIIDKNDKKKIINQIEKCKKITQNCSDNIEKGILLYYTGCLCQALQQDSYDSLDCYRKSLECISETDKIYWKVKVNEANELFRFGRSIEALAVYKEFFSQKNISEERIVSLIRAYLVLRDTALFIDTWVDYCIKSFEIQEVLNKILLHKSLPKEHISNLKNFLSKYPLKKIEYINQECNEKIKAPAYRKKDYNYRVWCRDNTLFLNHMNDIDNALLIMDDPITFPDYIAECPQKPHYSHAFSAIKRDYCFARFLAYEGISNTYEKFEEKDLYLTDDFSNYSGKVERLKSSITSAYSVFDKVACLMNTYYKTKCPLKDVYFRPPFFEKFLNAKKTKNRFLKAMYFISLELYKGHDVNFPSNSNDLKNNRTSLSHAWLRIREIEEEQCCLDDYSIVITPDKLERNAIQLLRLARSCLIYLTFAIKIEEKIKKQSKNNVVKLQVPFWQ